MGWLLWCVGGLVGFYVVFGVVVDGGGFVGVGGCVLVFWGGGVWFEDCGCGYCGVGCVGDGVDVVLWFGMFGYYGVGCVGGLVIVG